MTCRTLLIIVLCVLVVGFFLHWFDLRVTIGGFAGLTWGQDCCEPGTPLTPGQRKYVHRLFEDP